MSESLPSGEIRGGRVHETEPVRSYGKYVDWLRNRMQVVHDIAREHLENAANRHKYAYDIRIEHNRYEHGECMIFSREKSSISPKLQLVFVLCLVLKRHNDANYLIGLEGSGRRVMYRDKLKRYERGGDKVDGQGDSWLQKG